MRSGGLLVALALVLARAAPSADQVEDAAWTFILSAAVRAAADEASPAQPPPQSPQQFCRSALGSLRAWLPDGDARARLETLARGAVVRQRLAFVPAMSDCAVLLWYVRTAAALAAHGPRPSPSASELGVPADAFALDAEGAAAAAAAGLWEGEARAQILSALDRAWLGRAAAHRAVRSARPRLELFAMSACPYAQEVGSALVGSVLPALGETVDVVVHQIFFPRALNASRDAPLRPASLCASVAPELALDSVQLGRVPCSMHGQEEADEGLRQMAIGELYGARALLAYIGLLNAQGCAGQRASCFERAARSARLDARAVAALAARKVLEYAEVAYADVERIGAPALRGREVASPTLVVNGWLLADGSLGARPLLRRLCAFYEAAARPSACSAGRGDERAVEGAEMVDEPHGAACVRAEPRAATAAPRARSLTAGGGVRGTRAVVGVGVGAALVVAAALAVAYARRAARSGRAAAVAGAAGPRRLL